MRNTRVIRHLTSRTDAIAAGEIQEIATMIPHLCYEQLEHDIF